MEEKINETIIKICESIQNEIQIKGIGNENTSKMTLALAELIKAGANVKILEKILFSSSEC